MDNDDDDPMQTKPNGSSASLTVRSAPWRVKSKKRSWNNGFASWKRIGKRSSITGRSWSEKGVYAITRLWIGIKDGLPIRMWNGIWRTEEEPKEEAKPPQKALVKTWHSMATETARHNIRYLLQPSGTPIHQALKGLRGF